MWPFRRKRKARRSLPAVLRARFDAAQTTTENARHWAMADSLSADAAGSADVRRKLRQRARYDGDGILANEGDTGPAASCVLVES